MSRAQEGQVVQTAGDQNKQFNSNAQTSYTNAQGDISGYQDQLAKFAAANPYGEGGAYQTDENKVLANTADASAQSAGQAIQGAAVRTGQNAGGAIAATENMQQQNERNLSGQEAEAEAGRIGAGAGYGSQVLGASAVPAQLETTLAGQQAGAGNQALGVDQSASQTPSFLDELGNGVIQAGVGFAGGMGAGLGKSMGCWIAKELYGSWTDSRVILIRIWLHTEFRKRWYGPAMIWAYKTWGEQVAATLKPGTRRRAFFQRLFDGALEQAEQWHDARMETERQKVYFDAVMQGEVSRG